MRKVIKLKLKDDITEKIKQCDSWIEQDCIELVKILTSEPERYRPLLTALEAITLFGVRKQSILKGVDAND